MGHVFVRLSGFGMRLLPFWPYEFERDGDTPDRVRVTHWTDEGQVHAVVDRRHTPSTPGVVDVLPGPDHDHWLVETTRYGFVWPHGFVLGVCADPDDPKPFYLFGPDDAQIFPQGPVVTQNLPDAAAWTAPGQTLTGQYHLDDIEVFEFGYQHDGAAWWQTHWSFPVGGGRSLVITGQTPVTHQELIRGAIRQMVDTLRATNS